MSGSKSSPISMLLIAKHFKEIERAVTEAGDHTHPSERTKFALFLKLVLWSHKVKKEPCDSISNLNEYLTDLDDKILCDNLSEVWFRMQHIKNQVKSPNSETPTYLDFITNSTGLEAFLDLCLIHFLTLMLCPVSLGSSGVKFRIYNSVNVNTIIAQMVGTEQGGVLQHLGTCWKSFVESDFWQLNSELTEIPTVDQELYKSLSISKLIIFRGEFYYRKLVGDKKWHPLTPLRGALGHFQPAPLVVIRAIKSDIFAGIEDINIFAKINNNQLPRDWTTSGDFALIQYHDPSK